MELSRNPGKRIQLATQSFIAAFGGIKVLLISSGPMFRYEYGSGQGIRRVSQESGPSFEWRCNAEEWDELAELIDPLVRFPNAGHQYLTSYPQEDAIVVLSRGEYEDDSLTIRNPETRTPGKSRGTGENRTRKGDITDIEDFGRG